MPSQRNQLSVTALVFSASILNAVFCSTPHSGTASINYTEIPAGKAWHIEDLGKSDFDEEDVFCEAQMGNNFIRDVMWYLMQEAPLPIGYFSSWSIMEYREKVFHNDWGDFTDQYYKIYIVIISLLIFGIVMTLVGIISFVGHCCRIFGAIFDPCGKRTDALKRFLLNIILLVLIILLALGIIAGWISNIRIHKSFATGGAFGTYKSTLEHDFTNNVRSQMGVALRTNPHELTMAIERTMNTLLNDFKINWLSKPKMVAGSFTTIDKFQNAEALTMIIRKMIITFEEVLNPAIEYKHAFRFFTRYIAINLEKCGCSNMSYVEADEYGLNFDMVSRMIDHLSNIGRIGGIFPSIVKLQAVQNIADLEQVLNNTIKEYPLHLKIFAKQIETKYRAYADELENVVTRTNFGLHPYLEEDDKVASSEIHLSVPAYVIYFGTVACVLLTVIWICLLCGLYLGVFGADDGESGIHTRKMGSKVLITAAFIIYAASLIIALTTIMHTLLGGVAYRGVCDTSKRIKPRSIERFKCPENQSVYNVLFDNGIIPNANALFIKNELSTHIVENLALLSRGFNHKGILKFGKPEEYEKPWDTWTDAETSVQPAMIYSKGKYELSKYREKIQKALRTINKSAENWHSFENTLNQILGILTVVEGINDRVDKLMSQLKSDAETLWKNVLVVEGHEDFHHYLIAMVAEYESIRVKIINEANDQIKTIKTTFTAFCNREIEQYAQRVSDSLKNRIGLCPPDSFKALKADQHSHLKQNAAQSACNCFVDPMNAFWFAMIYCLVLFVPISIVLFYLPMLYTCEYNATDSFTSTGSAQQSASWHSGHGSFSSN